MNNDYLPQSREYFSRFIDSHLQHYKQIEKEYGSPSRSGYRRYQNDTKVSIYLISLVNMLDENFQDLSIPEEFPSPDALIESWNNLYQYMLENEVLLNKTISLLKERKEKSEPFAAIYKLHDEILKCLKHILNFDEIRSYQIKERSNFEAISKEKFDVVIVTALHDTEFAAFKRHYTTFSDYPSNNDKTQYLRGQIGKKSVLVATDDTMGMAASTSLTAKMIVKFSPQIIIMGGIAAGVKSEDSQFGDVLIARLTWNYESGKYQYKKKEKQIVFEPNPEQIEIDSSLLPLINSTKSDAEMLKSMHESYIATDLDRKPESYPAIKFGPMASGSAVIAHIGKIDEVRQLNRKLIGIDMETYGVYYGCKGFETIHSTKFLSVKSVSDFADKRKNDKYRNYAAFTSAKFIYELIAKMN